MLQTLQIYMFRVIIYRRPYHSIEDIFWWWQLFTLFKWKCYLLWNNVCRM